MRTDKILIVSGVPPQPSEASKATLQSKLTPQFSGETTPDALSKSIAMFAAQITKVLDEAETLKGNSYCVDQIEVSAVVTADGKIGILGSSFGGSVQGAMKFVWKRREASTK